MIIYRFIMKYYVGKNCDNPGWRADKKKNSVSVRQLLNFLGSFFAMARNNRRIYLPIYFLLFSRNHVLSTSLSILFYLKSQSVAT